MTHQYYGYPSDFTQQYQAALMAVTKTHVMRVARQYLNNTNLTLVVVGNPQAFIQPLQKVNPQLTRPEAKTATSQSTDASLDEGKKMLARAQAAAGGIEKLAAVKDYMETADYFIDPSSASMGGARIRETDRWVAPTFFRQDMILPM